MESNQELMILSLLNLYLSYTDLKKRNATKQLQNSKILKQKRQGSKIHSSLTIKFKGRDQSRPVTHFTSDTNHETRVRIVPKVNDEVKEKSFDNCISEANNLLIKESYTAHIADIIEFNQEEVIKSRKRGVKTKTDPNRKPRIRRWRVRPVNRDRAITGYHRKVFANIKKMDQQQFFEHTRMSKSLFDWLLTFAHSSLRKNKQSILAEERLAITLNYLAYGTPLQSIAWKYKVGKSTARQIVLDTCSALWSLLSPIYLSEPTTSQYADIAEVFKVKWDIPNCVGAISGKHVAIRVPTKSGSINNRDGLSMLILGVCDAKYKFLAVSVGSFNNQSDDETNQLSFFNKEIISDNMTLPSSKPLFPSSPSFPHFFISDTNFPFPKNLMCPYTETSGDATKTIFNYNISRACTVTDNTFGILTARFRVLLTTIEFSPTNCKTIILACIALHNFIMTNDEEQLYCPEKFVDRPNESGIIDEGEWRNELKNNGDQPLPTITSRSIKSTYETIKLRDTLANFFASEAISYDIQIV